MVEHKEEGIGEIPQDIESLKLHFAEENKKLEAARSAIDEIRSEIDEKERTVNAQTVDIPVAAEKCEITRAEIEMQRDVANEELAAALPFLQTAEEAIRAISQRELTEIGSWRNSRDIVKVTFDAINILFQLSLDPVTPKMVNINKANHPWIADSFEHHGIKNTNGPLLQNLLYFSSHEQNQINEETMELLEPYLNLESSGENPVKLFTPEIAAQTSRIFQQLIKWVHAISDYHRQSRHLQPKLQMLDMKTAELAMAQKALSAAQAQFDEVKRLIVELEAQYDSEVAKKRQIAVAMAKIRKQIDQVE